MALRPRVISVLPSATELLCLIPGGKDLLVGRSHECDYPKDISHLPVLTAARIRATNSADIDAQVKAAIHEGQSLYTLDEEGVKALRPDVILTQDLCDVCSIDLVTVERLAHSMNPRPKVVNLNPMGLADVLEDITKIGEAVGLVSEAAQARNGLQQRIDRATSLVDRSRPPVNVGWVEWIDPIFVAGHWTPELIEMAGGVHPLNKPYGKSVQVPDTTFAASDPDCVAVCPCGFDLAVTKKEISALSTKPWFGQLRAVKEGRVVLVDGNQMFNRPGPRLVDGLEYLVGWLQRKPEVIPKDFPWEEWTTQ